MVTRTGLFSIAAVILTVVVSACGGQQGPPGPPGPAGVPGGQGKTGPQGQSAPEVPLPEPFTEIETATRSFSQIVADSSQSVVAIRTPAGTGSGFFFSDGLILTNAHVVGHFNKVTINVKGGGCDGRCDYSPTGSVVRVDDVLDLAVISVTKTSRRPALKFGDSQQLEMAEEVIALGYPVATVLGFNLTVTKGIISSTFTLEGASYILTDAPLNPGNSGGPLLNSRGEVIGISTGNVKDPRSGLKFDGMGVVIPSNSIKERLPSLTE